jgi:protein SCO1/2
MRQIYLVQIILIGFVVFEFSGFSEACEKHLTHNADSSVLPSSSLYNMNSKWINQENQPIQLNELVGNPRLVAMVYTKCQAACPLLVQDIKSMTSLIPKAIAEKLRVDLFSFDSDIENFKSLKLFKEKYKLDERWSAYSGSTGSVAELAAALGIKYKKLPSGEYIHSNVIFLINDKGEIIAKHEGLGRNADEFIKSIQKAL